MMYIVLEVENEADLTDAPGRVVSVSSVHPYEDLRWDRRELGADERYVAVGSFMPVSDMFDRACLYGNARMEVKPAADWIPHTGTECPVHPLDVVEVKITGVLPGKPAQNWMWDKVGSADITHYRHVCDSDGIPYVYDDGSLPEWAEYVATDEDADPACFEGRPIKGDCGVWCATGGLSSSIQCPYSYANTRAAWNESLRRVWREARSEVA